MTLDDAPIEIVRQIKDALKLKSSFFIKRSNSDFFLEINNIADQVASINPIDLEFHTVPDNLSEVFKMSENKYDYIVCDFRYLSQKLIWQNDKISTKKSWKLLLEASLKLSSVGYALALIEPPLWQKEWENFIDILNNNNIFLNAIFNMPELYIEMGTGLIPILVLVSRKKMDELFIAELESGFDTEKIINNFVHNKSLDNIGIGIRVDEKSFRGFNQFHINDQIAKLQTKYQDYESYTLQDLSHVIKSKNIDEKVDNAIYIPGNKRGHVQFNLESSIYPPQNYFQVLLDKTIVLNEYAAQFFSTDIGKLIIDSLPIFDGRGMGPNSNIEEAIGQMVIAVPSLEEQNIIALAKKKLDSLGATVEKLEQELSLNPRSAVAVQDQVDDILLKLNKLSECDQLVSLTRKGESKTLEFKETFVLNVRTKSRDEEIVKSSLKTIVAFLNTSGGILLIGVHDNGSITGLNSEIDKFHKGINDRFLLFFKDKIKTKIGEDFYPFIDYKLVNCEDRIVLKVTVNESSVPCYFNNEEFFVRMNPATDQLKGPKLVYYIQHHFKL